jgi:hypothetical protein
MQVPPEEDIVSPLAARLLGAAGVLLVGGGVFLGWTSGGVTTAATAVVIAGAVLLSMFVPVVGGSAVASRFGAALVLGVCAWLVDPVTLAATYGRHARFSKGSPAERAMRVQQAKDGGQRDFRRLDLSGVDFSGMDLSQLNLDGSKLRGSIFRGTTLALVTLGDTDLTGADLSGADLGGVDVTTSVGWVETRCDERTRMPDGWICEDGHPLAAPNEMPRPATSQPVSD